MATIEYDFGNVSAAELHRVHNLFPVIPGFENAAFSTMSFRAFFGKLQFKHLADLTPSSRELLSEVYDKIRVDDAHRRVEAETRLAILKWLSWNDANGLYLDDELLAEDMDTMSLADAVEAIHEAHR